MRITDQIEKDFILAYKNKENEKVAVLRLIKAAFKNRQVELKRELSDAEALDVLIREVKQRQESVRQYSQAGREDLSSKESAEIEMINAYLPAKLTTEEMKEVALETINRLQVRDLKGMGQVMKVIGQKYPGRTDGRELSVIVRGLLSPQ
ncbi:GatB/YqeY domain-containing protein [Desulfonatronovibrio hydrogenovorans]|uniref:GatB/YqeY domain-containing protein n=1 Tax=Desulfonatronovibrio hydrogenovorans TaxID=53245 RepID=UPI00048F769B|nr:GatB/YqeY domain-containing protein [Desulfonatronovibrio hydrogenovorans]